MKKGGHILLGAVVSFLFIYLTIYLGFSFFKFNFKTIASVAFIIVFYSILPDIDHKNSTITWWFFGAGILGLLIGVFELIFKFTNPNPVIVLILSTGLLIVTFVSSNFFQHRGIVHTVQAGLIVSLPVYFLFNSIIYPILAYIVWHFHLIGDGFLFKTHS
jgi:hypothetical protein